MLLRLISLLGSWLAPKAKLKSGTKPKANPRPHLGSRLEPLEDRIAPATFVNAHIVTYTDIDGDHVTIKSSTPLFTKTNVNTIFTFSTGSVDGAGTPQQLQFINLAGLPSKLVAKDNISVTAKTASGGVGVANVGFIDSNFGLGHVLIQGDLGRIDAGTESSADYVGLASLTVDSLGAQGTATQIAGGNLISDIFGQIGSLTIQKDMVGAEISVFSNTAGSLVNGNIGSVRIGGDLSGIPTVSNGISGAIITQGNVNSIVIGGDLLGGAGTNSGSLQIGGKIGTLSVKDVVGYTVAGDTTGQGEGSASIVTGSNFVTGGIHSLTITGNVVGGDGIGSACIGSSGVTTGNSPNPGGSNGSVKIGGSITGGTGNYSAEITGTSIGAFSIGKGITGSSGINSGSIVSENGISSLTILHGGIVGGTQTGAGSVTAGTSFGAILVHGDITGLSTAAATITKTGQISAGSIKSLTVYGSLVGSTANESGSVLATGAIGHVSLRAAGTLTGSILGGTGTNSGELSALSIGSVSVAGQILGGGAVVSGGTNTGAGSAKILTTGDIGSLTIGHGITGGAGAGSGAIDVGTAGTGFTAKLGSLTISAGGIMGGAGAQSGQVNVGGTIGPVKLNGAAITAGAGADSGALLATDSVRSISLGSLVIGNGAGAGSGEISIGGDLGSLTFTGAGSTTADSGLVSVTGSAGTISVHGNVIGTGNSTGLFLIGSGVKRFSISGTLGSSVFTSDTGTDSGAIFAGLDDTGVIGSLTVSGGIFGGSGTGSGEVFSGGGINKAIVGDIIGGAGQSSGSIVTDYAVGAITVTGTGKGVATHGIIGGVGPDSGQISAGTALASVIVKGSLLGNGVGSGAIVSHSSFSDSGDIQGDIGRISITGSITGGTAANSGQISAAGNLKTVSVGGSVTGTLASGTGGILAGVDLAATTGGDITTLKIGGTLQGANVPAGQSGAINGSGYIEAGHIGSVTIHAIQAGTIGSGSTVTDDAAILAANDIASLRVTGSITGVASNPVVISAVGQLNPGKTDLAFGKISVAGNVAYTDFLAGYDQTGAPANGAASIGSVIVGGNWSGSNLVAGVIAGVSNNYGDPTDVLITSTASVIPTIASIIIKGNVTNPAGVTDSPDTYGFVAKKIEAFALHGVSQSVANGVINPVGQSTDTDLRDITSLSP